MILYYIIYLIVSYNIIIINNDKNIHFKNKKIF